MAIFCGACGESRNLPMSSMRTARVACQFCGGFDKIRVQKRGGAIVMQNLNNYSYPDSLMPTPIETGAEEHD